MSEADTDTKTITGSNDESFKDTISIVNKEGGRKWIYPKKPAGRFYNARTILSVFLLAFMFGAPWIKIDGHPFMLFNIIERRFILFGTVFTPQDFYLFGLVMIFAFVTLFLVTAVYGRIFCGWLCPQTVFLEMVFRKIEYFIEGDYIRQKTLNASPWDLKKIFKKFSKYGIFFIISFLIANTFLAYIIGTDELLKIISEPISEHLSGFISITVFTIFFYWIFAWFREQACILVCPYGRLQSVLLDKNSIVIAYDKIRGEPRGKVKDKQKENLGDCIDCKLCVNVCPTGIDIRNGTQLECVNCTACIDACDSIMDKVERPRGLIRFDSMESIEKRTGFKWTSRLTGYTSVLSVLLIVIIFLFSIRSEIDINILRTPGMLFQNQTDDKVSNMYNIKISNKTYDEKKIDLKIKESYGEIKLIGNDIILKPLEIREGSMLILLPKEIIKLTNTPVSIEVFSDGEKVDELKTNFLGPQNLNK
ncbi:MAG: cytochrome c oxidase accessory protein CcoG [Ignavibacteria bacterium]|nr:cytochrome c oxidase accessory protein CcoG [Ignavibacteria bacterium]